MRVLQALVIFMGVLIVAGVAVVAVTIVGRMSPSALPSPSSVLREPPGTHIASATANGRQLVVVLQGGGPDRIAIVDLATGKTTGHVALAQ